MQNLSPPKTVSFSPPKYQPMPQQQQQMTSPAKSNYEEQIAALKINQPQMSNISNFTNVNQS